MQSQNPENHMDEKIPIYHVSLGVKGKPTQGQEVQIWRSTAGLDSYLIHCAKAPILRCNKQQLICKLSLWGYSQSEAEAIVETLDAIKIVTDTGEADEESDGAGTEKCFGLSPEEHLLSLQRRQPEPEDDGLLPSPFEIDDDLRPY